MNSDGNVMKYFLMTLSVDESNAFADRISEKRYSVNNIARASGRAYPTNTFRQS